MHKARNRKALRTTKSDDIRVAITLAISIVVFLCTLSTAQAKITHECNAYYKIVVKSQGLTFHKGSKGNLKIFKTYGGCGRAVPDRCRRRARDNAQECMSDHWQQSSVFDAPKSCTGYGVKNYPFDNLQETLKKKACDLAFRHNRGPDSLSYDVYAISDETSSEYDTEACSKTTVLASDVPLTCNDQPAIRILPETVREARIGFSGRRDEVVQEWLNNLQRKYDEQQTGSKLEKWKKAIGDFEDDVNFAGMKIFRRTDDASMRSFRRIAAGLWALRTDRLNPGRKAFKNVPDKKDFIDAVTAWTEGIQSNMPGSPGGQDDSLMAGVAGNDYDMVMKEMIALLYLFKDDNKELTDKAAFNIVDKGFKNLIGQEYGKYMAVTYFGNTNPETENHVLMTYGSQYLINDYIRQNPRGEDRLTEGKYKNRSQFINEGKKLEDFLFQAAARVLHNGFFETNGRFYQGLTFQAMLNLYSYSKNPKLRLAYRNALDYLSTKFAFQSMEGKRFSPNRRNHKKGYSDSLEFYKRDAMNYVMGSLSGALRYRFPGGGNPDGIALWAMLSPYRIPEGIHDYMLNKHDGYWARMQARFTDEHYALHKWPKYFNKNGRAFGNMNQIEPAAELYFATPQYMNVSGGNYERYKVDYDFLKKENDVHPYDFLSVPQVLVTPGVTRDWGSRGELVQDYLTMWGEIRWWKSVNGGTYKGFSYGYFHAGDVSNEDHDWYDYINPFEVPGIVADAVTDPDRYKRWPMRVPQHWEKFRYKGKKGKTIWGRGRAQFRFYDFSHANDTNRAKTKNIPANTYLVLARVSKSNDAWSYSKYSRGFWEVVPASRFNSVAKLKEWVLKNNPPSHYTDKTKGNGKAYKYRMTTGELLELEDILGADVDRCYNPIKTINGANPALLAFDRCNKTTRKKMPLLEVHRIDPKTYANTDLIAYAKGDGKLSVSNPYLYFARTLELDSSDYKNPTRRETVSDTGKIRAPAHITAPAHIFRRIDPTDDQ